MTTTTKMSTEFRDWIYSDLLASIDTSFTYGMWGDDNTAATNYDTELGNEISRVAWNTSSYDTSAKTVTEEHFIDGGTWDGNDIGEFTSVNGSAGTTIVGRSSFDPVYAVSSSYNYYLTRTITANITMDSTG